MEIVTLDTNAIIYGFRGTQGVAQQIRDLKKSGVVFSVSTITEVELFSLPNLNLSEVTKIQRLLARVYVIPVDSVVARRAAEIRKRHKLKTPDAIIAATALIQGGKLLSRDKVFKKIDNLNLL